MSLSTAAQTEAQTTASAHRYLILGFGNRSSMFTEPLADTYKNVHQVVGFCDNSLTRMQFAQKTLTKRFGFPDVPHFAASDFQKAIRSTRATHVIICTPDATHAEYAVQAMEMGCDVICEKPIATTAEACRAVLETVEKTGRQFRLTFNFRWSPGVSKVKELVASGAIGNVKTVNLEYKLDTSHGADYFRRWHSQKDISGGLLVHKSTHHFDLVNWWLDGIPEQVFAYGDLVYYGKENAIQRGQEKWTQYPRYTGHECGDDPFADLRVPEDYLKNVYLNAEKDSGYIRDLNVFRDGITIEDTMSVMVKYRAGQAFSYTLTAFNSIEGFTASLIGDCGRIEYSEMHQNAGLPTGNRLTLFPLFEKAREISVVIPEEGHGGGDILLQKRMFASDNIPDPLNRDAGVEQGLASALIGIAANRSIETNLPVNIRDLAPIRPGAKFLHELA